MTSIKLKDEHFPAQYKAADKASLKAQSHYFLALKSYLVLLIIAALCSFYMDKDSIALAVISLLLFLITVGILIWMKTKKPDDVWYNGRAVAESVKTRTWRWVMKAEPYEDRGDEPAVKSQFVEDIKKIVESNQALSGELEWEAGNNSVCSQRMLDIRNEPFAERLKIYVNDRVQDQADWYATKSKFNKHRAEQWFWLSIILHVFAIVMLILRLTPLNDIGWPVEVIAAGASAVLTWLQAKKHGELRSSYSLATNEIIAIKALAADINSEPKLAQYVLDSEAAFSREHTQWMARKSS